MSVLILQPRVVYSNISQSQKQILADKISSSSFKPCLASVMNMKLCSDPQIEKITVLIALHAVDVTPKSDLMLAAINSICQIVSISVSCYHNKYLKNINQYMLPKINNRYTAINVVIITIIITTLITLIFYPKLVQHYFPLLMRYCIKTWLLS